MRKLLIFALVFVVLIGGVSAFEFDNIKNYDSQTKTVDIRNSVLGIPFLQLDKVAEVELTTEEHRVIHSLNGYVMEWEITNYGQYSKFIKSMQSYKNTVAGEPINIQYKYKYFNEKVGTHNELKYHETSLKNGTVIQEPYYEEAQGSWVELNELSDLPEGEIKVRIYLDSKIPRNQVIELVPTLFGVEITEWATYELREYYDTGDNTQLTINSGSGGAMLAQTFTPDADYTIGKVELKLLTAGTEGTLYGCLANTTTGTTAGDPDTTSCVQFFNNVSDGTVGETVGGEWYNLTFSGANASVETNITYAIILLSTGADDSNDYNWRSDQTGATYDEWGFKVTQDLGGGWIRDGDGDLMFRIFSVVPTDNPPIIIAPYPINNTLLSVPSMNVTANVSDDISVANVSITVNGLQNQSNSSGQNGTRYSFDLDLSDGQYDVVWNATDSASQNTFLHNRFTIDTISPSLNITQPHGNFYHQSGNSFTLRWNYSDANPGVCRYEYEGTNTTVNCADNTSNIAAFTDVNNVTLTFYSNDSLGHTNNTVVTWNYSVWEHDRGFNNATFEGATELYYVDFTILSGSLSTAKLWYNGNDTSSLFSSISSRRYNATLNNFIVPTTDTNKVVSFFWELAFGSTQINTTSSTQHINAFAIDNCTVNTVVLYNFTISDEDNRLNLSSEGDNTQAKVELNITGYSSSNEVLTFNSTYDQINPFLVCANDTITTQKFNIDALIEYSADDYETEFYNFQNDTLNSSYMPKTVTLYDLNSSVAQAFKLIVKDSSFLAIDDALIEIHRRYVDQSNYKIVEIPKTDEKGESIGHLVTQDVLYKFVIKKFGEIIATFSDVRPDCQNPTITECAIDFNAFASNIVVPDYTSKEDFNFTLGYNNDTRIISSSFLIPSGGSSLVLLNVTQTDALGSSVCTDSLTSSSGTLSCTVPNSIGNSTVIAKLYKNGNLEGQGTLNLGKDAGQIYGVVAGALALFIMLTLVGAAVSDNPVVTTIFLMLGVILLFLLGLVNNNGFIGGTILWLIIAMLIIIGKGARRN